MVRVPSFSAPASLADLRYQDLAFLLSLSETESLTQTSALLDWSMSSASRRLAALRELFEDELFVRSGSAMLPTRRMRELITPIRALLEQTHHLLERPDFNLEDTQRTLRFVVSDHIFHGPYTGKVLQKFYEMAPRARVDIVPPDRSFFEKIRNNEADMGYVLADEIPSDFHSVNLYRGRYALLMRADHPLACATSFESLDMERLRHTRAIEMTDVDDFGCKALANIRAYFGQETGLSTPYYGAVLNLVRTTNFTYLGPMVTLRRFLLSSSDAMSFKVYAIPLALGSFEPKLIWHHSTHMDPFFQWIRSVIIDTCRTEAMFLEAKGEL